MNQNNEINDNNIGNSIFFLGKKTGRSDAINEDNSKRQTHKKEKIMDIKYRHDYYIMAFKTNFLEFMKNKLNYLINNISLCKKFGQHNIHTPNRKLYGGNPKEKDNREFINKTVEEVFIDQGVQRKEEENNEKNINKDVDKKGISLQKENEIIFNKIKNKICLTKFEHSQKYKEQSDAVEILIKLLSTKIRDVLDEYYDSEKFEEFRSNPKIKYFDDKFKKERNRSFSLLEKNNFVKLVEMPFYIKKNE